MSDYNTKTRRPRKRRGCRKILLIALGFLILLSLYADKTEQKQGKRKRTT